MSRKDTVNTLFMQKLGAPNSKGQVVKGQERVRTGAISSMSASLQEMTEGARTAARLQEQISTGSVVVDLDPADIDGSMVIDRLVADIDPRFDELVESIRENGQQVPILVRPHPQINDRFQIAYGHRRLRAIAKLRQRVRAVVKDMSDSELVIAQGKENLDRKDLSFIEKSLFAARLEDAGFDRSTIMSALSTDKADLSRYLKIARTIPSSVVEKIGPAPKAGRQRWVALATLLQPAHADTVIEEISTSEKFRSADSDARFRLVFELLDQGRKKSIGKGRIWKNPHGKKAGRIEYGNGRTTLTFDEKTVPAFGNFLAAHLDELFDRFERESNADTEEEEDTR